MQLGNAVYWHSIRFVWFHLSTLGKHKKLIDLMWYPSYPPAPPPARGGNWLSHIAGARCLRCVYKIRYAQRRVPWRRLLWQRYQRVPAQLWNWFKNPLKASLAVLNFPLVSRTPTRRRSVIGDRWSEIGDRIWEIVCRSVLLRNACPVVL